MVMTPKERELVAVGISVAVGCWTCTNFHTREAHTVGAAEADIRRAIVRAVEIRRTAANMIEAHALARLEDLTGREDAAAAPAAARMDALVSVGAALAAACPVNLKVSLAAAKTTGIAEDEVLEIATLATFIRSKAASNVRRMVGRHNSAVPS
jgi:AhpD family alkylhydroperoxidase